MCPKIGEADNLLVPVAISASSVAYSSTRIEQMFLDAGTAAGAAVALALEESPAGGAINRLQDTNVTAVFRSHRLLCKQFSSPLSYRRSLLAATSSASMGRARCRLVGIYFS